MTVLVDEPADLGPPEILALADGAGITLAPGLLERLGVSLAQTLAALDTAGPVYGVTTGLGGQAHLTVERTDPAAFQGDLMLARAVGTAPWLDRRSVRATLATRLRTLLDPETGVSPALAVALAAALDCDMHPAVPATGNGAAGEIIPLAHLGGFLAGHGDGLDATGVMAPADLLLREAGLTPYSFAAKEGVAFLQGAPAAVGCAVLLGADARLLARAEASPPRPPRSCGCGPRGTRTTPRWPGATSSSGTCSARCVTWSARSRPRGCCRHQSRSVSSARHWPT